MAYQEVQNESVDWLNLYANVESTIEEVLMNEQFSSLEKKLALWLYITFTSK